MYGVVKTKDRYFSIKNPRFGTDHFGNFELKPSLDKEHIVLVEKPCSGVEKRLIVIIDMYSLKVVSEQEVHSVRDDITVKGENRFYDVYFNHNSSEYFTLSSTPDVVVWNKGKYIMYAITKTGRSVHYLYEVYDTEKQKVVKSYERSGELQVNTLMDVKPDISKPDNLCILIGSPYTTKTAKWNIFEEQLTILGTFDHDTSRIEAKMNDSCTQIYLGFYCCVGNLYCKKMYVFRVNETAKIDPSTLKGHQQILSYQSLVFLDKDNAIYVNKSDSNTMETFV